MAEEPEDAGLPADDTLADNGAGGEDNAAQAVQEAEDKASRMGWVPKDQFKGDPEKWTDAETFVKRGEEFLPFLKANNRKLEQALEKATGKIAEMEQTFGEFKEFHSKTQQRAYQAAMRDLEAKQAQAVEANDLEGVRAVAKEITDLTKEVAAPAKPEPKIDPARTEALETWKGENPWYGVDTAMTGAAYAIADELAGKGVVDPEKQLAEVAKRIRADFPHKFENPRRRDAPAVERPSNGSRSLAKGVNDLPPEAKAAGLRYVKQGLMKSIEEYAKEYFA